MNTYMMMVPSGVESQRQREDAVTLTGGGGHFLPKGYTKKVEDAFEDEAKGDVMFQLIHDSHVDAGNVYRDIGDGDHMMMMILILILMIG